MNLFCIPLVIYRSDIHKNFIMPLLNLQLLKCLFGTNLSAQWVEPDDNQRTSSSSSSCTSDQNSEGFYGVCFQTPYRHLTDFVTSPSNKAQDKDEGFM